MTLITVESAADLATVARDLIAAAGGDVSRIRVVTTGRLPAFEVDREVESALVAKYNSRPKQEPAPAPSAVETPIPAPPKRNASRTVWAEYMAAAPFFLDGAEAMERAALIAAYDAWIADHA